MSHSPPTRQSLLLRLRDTQDALAWQEFVDIYAPLIHAYARRRGLQDADAADVAQTVLQSVAQAIPDFTYDSSKGSFRGWLFTITRNHLFKMLAKRKRIPTATGDTSFHEALAQQPSDMDMPNDVVDNSPPPFVTQSMLQGERGGAESPNHLGALRLSAAVVNQILSDGFESGDIR